MFLVSAIDDDDDDSHDNSGHNKNNVQHSHIVNNTVLYILNFVRVILESSHHKKKIGTMLKK